MSQVSNSDIAISWLDSLGYLSHPSSLHQSGGAISALHPYASELEALLSPNGDIKAQAVFDIEGVPTVCFFGDDGGLLKDERALAAIRQIIWNQNLVSLVLITEPDRAVPIPITRQTVPGEEIKRSDASRYGHYSVADFLSCDIQQRNPNWFRPENRLDKFLLKNLKYAVEKLDTMGFSRETAQYLIGQLLFVSYLEHRGIVSSTYQTRRNVMRLHTLIESRNRHGIEALLNSLKQDFNGDFLNPIGGEQTTWQLLPEEGFRLLDNFLKGDNLENGQQSFWGYDFRYIPVELISGIYESFLGSYKKDFGAYYTPRHLANLVIEQALITSQKPLQEVIYDGACGSGILLTTIFRRLLGMAEDQQKRQLSLRERIELLQNQIYGSDINESACRVTAFSLYLSLLERLVPADIAELQENEDIKLPTLIGKNLFMGENEGDFFSPNNPLVSSKRFTLFLSNPPWLEPKGEERLTSDDWAEDVKIPRARRQMAGDFTFRAIGSLKQDGRLCLILPVSLFLAPTSSKFVQGLLDNVRIHRIINFGDLRKFLFPQAKHGCVVLLASPRPDESIGLIPINEMIEYWIPKTDVSLAFQRLTLHSGDRHNVHAQAIRNDNSRLVTLFWGDEFDISLLSRLRSFGTFGEMTNGKQACWGHRKGFHANDKHTKDPVSSEPLREIDFIDASSLREEIPVLHESLIDKFPEDIETISRLSDELMSVFSGPRILFPDGASSDREIRATFFNRPGSFKSSVGVITGPEGDEDLLRFASVYLRSGLTKYFLIMTAYQLLTERERVTLTDVSKLPFIRPEHHPDPDGAWEIVKDVANITRNIEGLPLNDAVRTYNNIRPQIEDNILKYFMINNREADIVKETLRYVTPSLQPSNYEVLYTPLHNKPNTNDLKIYADYLKIELESWRDSLGGKGRFEVCYNTTPLKRTGPFGIISVEVKDCEDNNGMVCEKSMDWFGVHSNHTILIEETIKMLRDNGILPLSLGENLYYAPDTVIRNDRTVYLVKPLTCRMWLRHRALRDARNIVMAVRKAIESTMETACK